MNYKSEEIVKRIKASLIPWEEHIEEKRMFGGTCFLYKGKMCVGEIKEKLMARVLSNKMNAVLNQEHVIPMDFTGKPMKEFIYVNEKGFDSFEKLQYFIELGIEHAKSKTDQK